MEDLIPLLIFGLLSAVGSWIQGRREKAKEVSWDDVEGEEPETMRAEGVPEVKTFEDELRKALGFPRETAESNPAGGQPPAIPKASPKTAPAPPVAAPVREAATPTSPAPKSESNRPALDVQEALRAAREKRESAQRARQHAWEEGRRGAPRSKTELVESDTTESMGSVTRLGKTLRSRRSARVALAASVALGKPRAFEPYQATGDR